VKLEQRYTAKQVAGIAIGSGCVAFLIITAINLPWESRVSHQVTLWVELSLLLTAVIAVALMYYALAAFARGVEEELWDKASLDRIRTFVEKGWWMVLLVFVLVFAMGLIAVDLVTRWPRHHNINGGMSYFWVSPILAVMQIRGLLKPKKKPGESIWVGEVKPLISEHWGNRGPSHH
jgi:hypothetical protein